MAPTLRAVAQVAAVLLGLAQRASADGSATPPVPARRGARGLGGLARGPAIRLAVTVDDLPASGDMLPDWPPARLVSGILHTLERHGVPGVVGFFNGANMDAQSATPLALQAWCRAGYSLGNHTYEHICACDVPGSAFVADIARDEQALIALMGPRCTEPRYFRYPGLHRGRGADAAVIRAHLEHARYRIADASLDFADWAFTDAFVRCVKRGNAAAAQSLEASMVRHAVAELAWAVSTAREQLARPIPHILLIHASPITAHHLDAVLTAYERLGVRYISLEEALRDPVYAEADDDSHGDGNVLRALLAKKRVQHPQMVMEPLRQLERVCR